MYNIWVGDVDVIAEFQSPHANYHRGCQISIEGLSYVIEGIRYIAEDPYRIIVLVEKISFRL